MPGKLDDVSPVLFPSMQESTRRFLGCREQEMHSPEPWAGLTLAALQCMVASGCLGRKDGWAFVHERAIPSATFDLSIARKWIPITRATSPIIVEKDVLLVPYSSTSGLLELWRERLVA